MIEILVASGIFLIAVVYAVGSIFFSKGAADRTDRVDEYREVRILFNRIARDLQEASRVRIPTYDFYSSRLEFTDGLDRTVVYALRDSSGTELAAAPPETDPSTHRLVRTAGTGNGAEVEVIRQSGNVRWLRFTRLGERLVGITVYMKSRDGERPGKTYTATVAVSRVVL